MTRDSDVSRLRNAPICTKESNPRAGYTPPSQDVPFKIVSDITFKRTVRHSSGREFSTPPSSSNYDQGNVPATLRQELRDAVVGILGPGHADINLCDHRICWDLMTPSENFIISPFPPSEGVFLATAGSFHGFKMLPIIGGYVVQMLDGTLDPQLAKLWAWDSELPIDTPGGRELFPSREFGDL